MQQVLFRIPIPGLAPNGIPIYGFGVMLFLAFVICTWLGSRRAERVGISRIHIQDLGIWLFVGGIIGARLASVLLEGLPLSDIFRIWDGGLVFYGSAIGGLVGYIFAYIFVIRKRGISTWKLADVIAPCIAIGLCLGRIGCLLNGCCYGNVACAECSAQIHFPLSSPPRFSLVHAGYQTAAGFTLVSGEGDEAKVGAIESHSPAAAIGLKPGDVIVNANGHEIQGATDLDNLLGYDWPRGKNDLQLTVKRDGKELALPAFTPRTIGLHPTQVYESISMILAFILMLSYEPFKRRSGEVMAVMMICYGAHRFLNELLRDDPRPIGFERYISVFLVVAGAGLILWFRRPVLNNSPSIGNMAAATS